MVNWELVYKIKGWCEDKPHFIKFNYKCSRNDLLRLLKANKDIYGYRNTKTMKYLKYNTDLVK